MKQKLTTLISIITIISCFGLNAAVAQAAGPSTGMTKLPMKVGLRKHLFNGTSTNWSGYAVENNFSKPTTGSVNEVSGEWTVPTVSCPTRTNSYSSDWVGIDGYSSPTVEQTGTDSDCSRGHASYYAWFEFYPQYMYELSLPVSPGNTMSADVKYTGNNNFTLTISNVTQNKTYPPISESVPGAERTSAEWIVEAPSSFFGVLPLAEFSTTSFSNASVNVNGSTGSINDHTGAAPLPYAYNVINMVTDNGVTQKDVTSPLSTDGTSFSVQWKHS